MSVASTRAEELALGLLGDKSELLMVARRISGANIGPILGGVAVFMHGYRRTTKDVDVFALDTQSAAAGLEGLGATWDPARREHVLSGVPIHIVTTEQVGAAPAQTVEVDGVRIVSLADLIAIKLASGLASVRRAQDLADVVGLITSVPLDKSFAASLPNHLRAEFKRLCDAVRD